MLKSWLREICALVRVCGSEGGCYLSLSLLSWSKFGGEEYLPLLVISFELSMTGTNLSFFAALTAESFLSVCTALVPFLDADAAGFLLGLAAEVC